MELLHLDPPSQKRRAPPQDVRSVRTITDWSLLGDRVHGVQFYEEDAALIDLLSGFVGTALVTGESAVVFATRKHREALAQCLRKRGLDISVAATQNRFVAIDAARCLAKLMRGDKPDPERVFAQLGRVLQRASRAAEGSRRRVAVFGEMVALLWAEGKIEAAIRLEELWNTLTERHAVSLCCAYPMRGFAGSRHAAPFLKICAQHSHVFPAERRARATAAFV